jgi:hypothetical protein
MKNDIINLYRALLAILVTVIVALPGAIALLIIGTALVRGGWFIVESLIGLLW